MMTRNTVIGIFDDRDDASRAIEALKDSGFSSEDIGITMRDKRDTEALIEDTGASAGAGAASGALAGGALGGLAGWLVGLGALAIPGIGPFIAAGPLAAALTGAAIGAAGGGLLGALTGMGVPEEEARWYEGEVHGGGILVTVTADGRFDDARRMIRQYGGREAEGEEMGGTASMDRGYAGTRGHDADRMMTEDRETVQLREEQLRARKETVEAGEDEIRKEVVSEQRTIEVPVTREEVVIERRPVDRVESDLGREGSSR